MLLGFFKLLDKKITKIKSGATGPSGEALEVRSDFRFNTVAILRRKSKSTAFIC